MTLLPEVEEFINQVGMPPTRFGRLAAGDPRFVLDLRMGRMPRQQTRLKIMSFINQWGEKRYVPRPVGRPRKAEKVAQ